MVKKNGNNSKKQKKAPRGKPVRDRSMSVYIDEPAMAHARLLADPCQGRLVPAAYPQPGGGAIQRFRVVLSTATGAGDTAAMFHWVPGLNEYYNNASVAPGTVFTPAINTVFPGLSLTPGVGTSATTFRCLAACMRVMTNASEANRAGMLYAGQTSAAYYGTNAAAGASVQSSINGLPVTSRVPSRYLEVLWTPLLADQSFVVDSLGTASTLGQGNYAYGACTFGALGLPVGTGLTIELTGVYEINYASNGNVVANPPPVTLSSWQSVLRAYNSIIHNAPVVVDSISRAVDYIGAAASSQPGRLVAGAAMRYLTM